MHTFDEIKDLVVNHPRNENISFNKEKHEYTFLPNGEKFKGITSLISEYNEDFDLEGISFAVARKEGTTQAKIKAKWKRKGDLAIKYGNQVHDMIEDFHNDGVIPDGHDENFEAYNEAIIEMGLDPICAEWVIYDERINRASAIDGVYYADGYLLIGDYKTNEEYQKIYNVYKDKRFFYPISELPDSKFFKYCLQLNIYHKILSDLYDVPLRDEMFILHIRDGETIWVPIPKLRKQVDKLYEDVITYLA